MNAKFTTGEWQLCDFGAYTDFNGHSRVILGAHRRLAVVQVQSPEHIEDNANALVMFAAPELFEALQGLFLGGFIEAGTRGSGEWHDGERMQGQWEGELEERLVPCRAALAKALGETP